MGKGTVRGNQDGVVLVLALFLIAALSFIGVAAHRNITMDTAIASNHLGSVQAFYIAEAGLERGKLEAVHRFLKNNWDTLTPLLDGSAVPSYDIALNSTNVSYSGGTFAVNVVNDERDLLPNRA